MGQSFKEFMVTFGMEVDMDKLFGTLYNKALEGDKDCGGLLSYCYFSGEPVTGFEEAVLCLSGMWTVSLIWRTLCGHTFILHWLL